MAQIHEDYLHTVRRVGTFLSPISGSLGSSLFPSGLVEYIILIRALQTQLPLQPLILE